MRSLAVTFSLDDNIGRLFLLRFSDLSCIIKFMTYNIQLQVAGFITVLVLTIVFCSKKRWKSIQNSIFRILMFVTLLELALDAISVVTICHREQMPLVNMLLSKAYLVAMILYIYTIDIYTLSNTLYENISRRRLRAKQIVAGILTGGMLAANIVIVMKELLFGGEGVKVFSYGTPSDAVYIFSTASVVFVIATLIINHRHIPIQRQISIYSFCVMEGIVAIVQMFNKELLIVGFGSAMTILIMYFTLENPDMEIIAKLNEANKRSRDLLLNILPEKIADRLQQEQSTFTQEIPDASILFLDIVGFSSLSNKVGSVRIVKILNALFSNIDNLLGRHSVEKIKTIGDSYMAAAGVPTPYTNHCEEIIGFSKDILRLLKLFNQKYQIDLKIRIGINSGSVVAGIIGKKKFVYDLWGVSVNLASRMESYGEVNRINVSPSVYKKLKNSAKIKFEELGERDIKGFGTMKMYAVV